MADGQLAGKGVEVWFPKDLSDQAHLGVYTYLLTVGGGNSGAFLPPVLEGKEAEENQTAGLSPRHIHPNHATLFIGVVKGKSELRRVQPDIHNLILVTFRSKVNYSYRPVIKDSNIPFRGALRQK